MALRKAVDDLREVTLAALPGRWAKLLYFAKLRINSGGKYSHWGFENRHGKEAEPAMREAHASVYRDVLQTPVPELLEDCLENGRTSEVLVTTPVRALVPPEAQSERHFRYLIASLEALLRRKK
jgi:hypothetical protein